MVPVLLGAVSATQTVLAGEPLGDAAPWLKRCWSRRDVVYLVVGRAHVRIRRWKGDGRPRARMARGAGPRRRCSALAFGYAPARAVQGNVQRIMYLHVPAVLTAYLAFALVFVGSVGYLAARRRRGCGQRWRCAAAEPGVLFTGITIASGSIWGKPTWGTWWTWDARLTTSTAVLFLVTVGYLLLRGMVDEPERGRALRRRAWASSARANIPIVHFSGQVVARAPPAVHHPAAPDHRRSPRRHRGDAARQLDRLHAAASPTSLSRADARSPRARGLT